MHLIRLFLFLSLPGWLMAQRDSLPVGIQSRTPVIRWVAPAALTGLGVFAAIDHSIIDRFGVRAYRQKHFAPFSTSIDDVMPFMPIAAAYVLDWAGEPAAYSFKARTLHLIAGEAVMLATIYSLKTITNVQRPDGSNFRSFPSGHTAQAFLAASFLQHEYGKASIVYPIAGYILATGVGALRILNNRHWISDVLAGAGIGILSGELSYHLIRFRHSDKVTAMPVWTREGPAFYAQIRF